MYCPVAAEGKRRVVPREKLTAPIVRRRSCQLNCAVALMPAANPPNFAERCGMPSMTAYERMGALLRCTDLLLL